MKKKKWTVDSDKKIGWIIEFIKKYLKLEANEKLVSKMSVKTKKKYYTCFFLVLICESNVCSLA